VPGKVLTSTGGKVNYWVQYGPTESYGSETPHEQTSFELAPNSVSPSLHVQLEGLTRSTTYHYRFCASDSQQQGGPGCGEDKSFTTPNLECGDTITHDFTLSGDVECFGFTTDGLVVGADGIDVNLNGHTLSGPIVFTWSFLTPYGVDNTAGHDDVTIRNGTVTLWGTAIVVRNGSFNAVRGVDAVVSNSGIAFTGGEGNLVRASRATGAVEQGVLARDSEGLVVADSSGRWWSVRGDRARIVRNHLQQGAGDEICLEVLGNRNRVADTTIAGCDSGGLVVSGGSDNELVGNEVFGSPELGFRREPDGIRVEAFTTGTLLDGNLVHNNEDDGIDVRSAGARLRNNSANDNGDFGIDAVAGVTDLGGNTASGNGNPLQCRNVFCP
jgi:parallel beta-helix repeat protein